MMANELDSASAAITPPTAKSGQPDPDAQTLPAARITAINSIFCSPLEHCAAGTPPAPRPTPWRARSTGTFKHRTFNLPA